MLHFDYSYDFQTNTHHYLSQNKKTKKHAIEFTKYHCYHSSVVQCYVDIIILISTYCISLKKGNKMLVKEELSQDLHFWDVPTRG